MCTGKSKLPDSLDSKISSRVLIKVTDVPERVRSKQFAAKDLRVGATEQGGCLF